MTERVFTYPLWAGGLSMAVAIALIAWGFVLRRKGRSVWTAAVAAGLLVGGVLGPMLFTTRVVVGDTRVTQTTGFWFALEEKRIEFAPVQWIVIRTADSKSFFSSKYEEVWYITDKNGDTVRHHPSDLWLSHSEAIERLIDSRGVPVSREP